MTVTPDPYGITVGIDLWTMEDDETREEWDAWHRLHTPLILKSALEPTADHGLSRDDVFSIYKWCAGVLARMILDFPEDQFGATVRQHGHRCSADPETALLGGCGWSFYEGVVSAREAVLLPLAPQVTCVVPTELAKTMTDHFRGLIAGILADDAAPLPAPAQTEPAHGQVVLTAAPSATHPRKEHA